MLYRGLDTTVGVIADTLSTGCCPQPISKLQTAILRLGLAGKQRCLGTLTSVILTKEQVSAEDLGQSGDPEKSPTGDLATMLMCH